jgi:predicted transcriptional regulator
MNMASLFRNSGYTDIKEAPLHINNALKDETKRKILRSLKTEKKYLTVIAGEIGESVAKAKYHLAELERLGLVDAMQLSREKFFVLTEKGRWCVRAIDHYYPKNYLQRVMNKTRSVNLKWKET